MNVSNMAQALAARDDGISSSSEHAESDAPGWGQRAYATIAMVAKHTDGAWTMEAIRRICYYCGLDKPAEERAFGAVTQRLLRDGIIEPVGYAKAASSHSSIKRTYRICRGRDGNAT
jgi:hypothetical protein